MNGTVELSQGTLKIRDTGGSGPVLFFVHGLLVNGRLWDQTVDELATDFRCVIPDLPLGSHTRAMNEDADLSPPGLAQLIADALEQLDLHDVILVGNDTGGALCQLVAVRHPERVERLVLTNCDAYENFLPPFFRPLQWIGRSRALVWLTAQAFRPRFAQNGVLKLLAHTKLDPRVVQSFARPFIDDPGARHDVAKVLRSIDKRHTLEAAAHFADFDRPVLLAWGTDDRFFKTKYAERLAAAFPEARLESISGSKTFVPVDKPVALAEAIRRFVL